MCGTRIGSFSGTHPYDIRIGWSDLDGTNGGGGQIIRYTFECNTVVVGFPYAAMTCSRVNYILVGRVGIFGDCNIGDPGAYPGWIEIAVFELTEYLRLGIAYKGSNKQEKAFESFHISGKLFNTVQGMIAEDIKDPMTPVSLEGYNEFLSRQ